MTVPLTRQTRITAAVFLLLLITVEFGGAYLEGVVTGGDEVTAFQLSFARAGHAHAGVLVILALVGLLYADAARLAGASGFLGRYGIAAAAVLMSAGFFLSSTGEGRTSPNGLVMLLWIGAVTLAVSLVTLAVQLIRSSSPSLSS